MDAFLLQQSLFDPQELPIPPRMGSEKTWQLDNGYVYEFAPDHPAADLHGRVLQHRLVMEWKLGRMLEQQEVVHHRNDIKNDNAPSNLELFANNVEHLKSHGKRRDPALIEAVRIAAADPKVPMHSLPASSVLVRLICKENNIEWISADKTHLTDEKVLQAIQLHPGLSVYKIAEILGVAGSHLYLNYSHLFVKRKPPGYLDQFREEICKSAIALYGQDTPYWFARVRTV